MNTATAIPASVKDMIPYLKSLIQEAEPFGGLTNDELTKLFSSMDAEGYVHLTKKGMPYITAKDGGVIDLTQLTPDYVSRVTDDTFTQMIRLSETYVAQRNQLVYGNYKTPFNDETTNEIDCSSFTQLILYGVSYETSRYVNGSSENEAKVDFGFKFPNNPYSDEFGPRRYLANELAHYAFDHDFAFYPNEDATNIQPGDIVFFSTNTKNPGYFMDITHVAICVEREGDDLIAIVHGNSVDVANYYRIHLFTPLTIHGSKNVYMNSLRLIARFPIQMKA